MPDDRSATAPEPPTGDPGPRSGAFTRSRTDRMIGGVAGGLAARLDIDPLIVRGAFVVLAIAGGGGILLYLLGWLLLPEDGAPDSIAGQTLGTRGWDTKRTRQIIIAGLVALAFFTVIRPWHGSFGRPIVAIAAVAAIVAFSRRHHSSTAPPTWGPGFHGPGGGTPPNPFPGPPGGSPTTPFPGPAGGTPANPFPGPAGGTTTTPFPWTGHDSPTTPIPGPGTETPDAPSSKPEGETPDAPSSGPEDQTPAAASPAGSPPVDGAQLTESGTGDAGGIGQWGPDPTFSFDPSADLAFPDWSASPRPGDPMAWWPPATTPRQPSIVPPLLAGLAVLLVLSAAISATGWVSVPLPAVMVVALLMCVAALVVGARRGRFVGVTLLTVTCAGVLVLSTAVPHPFAGGIGQRTWHPASASDLQRSYRLGSGQATLDLSDLAVPSALRIVRASVGTGDLAVTVPAATVVQVRERTGMGSAEIFGDRQSGLSVDRTSIEPSGRPTLDLDLQVGIGTIEVHRAAA